MGADFDFARRSENQSGQRSLDSSDPRLIRHAALCEAAGGKSISRLPVRMKAVPGCGAAPRHIARVARVSLLSLPYYRVIVTSEEAGHETETQGE